MGLPEQGDKPEKKSGQTLSEMALVLPIFLILFFAILEFGFMLFRNVSVANGTREGVRRAAMNNLSKDEIKAVIQQHAWAANLAASEIDVSTQANDPNFPNSPPTVTIVTNTKHTWFLLGILLDDLPLRSSQKSVVVTYPGNESINF